MIRVTCKNCQSKINAKDELLGQTRRCPKCQAPLLIEPDPAPKSAVVVSEEPAIEAAVLGEAIGEHFQFPQKLEFAHRYFILNQDRVLASWETPHGWLFNVGSGFLPAKRNFQAIPDQGSFAFVELMIDHTDEGQRLKGLRIYKISARGSLLALTRDENEILQKIDCPEPLSRVQKAALLTHIRKQFMFDFLSQAQTVLDYLSNDDFVSTHVE